jgi:hypothetical protein
MRSSLVADAALNALALRWSAELRNKEGMRRRFAIAGLFVALLLSGCSERFGCAGHMPSKADLAGAWIVKSGVHAGKARIEFAEDGEIHLKDVPYAYLLGVNRADLPPLEPPSPEDPGQTRERSNIPDDSDLVSASGEWRVLDRSEWNYMGNPSVPFWADRGLLVLLGAYSRPYWQIDLRLDADPGGPSIYYERGREEPHIFLQFDHPDRPKLLYFYRQTSSPNGHERRGRR